MATMVTMISVNLVQKLQLKALFCGTRTCHDTVMTDITCKLVWLCFIHEYY